MYSWLLFRPEQSSDAHERAGFTVRPFLHCEKLLCLDTSSRVGVYPQIWLFPFSWLLRTCLILWRSLSGVAFPVASSWFPLVFSIKVLVAVLHVFWMLMTKGRRWRHLWVFLTIISKSSRSHFDLIVATLRRKLAFILSMQTTKYFSDNSHQLMNNFFLLIDKNIYCNFYLLHI